MRTLGAPYNIKKEAKVTVHCKQVLVNEVVAQCSITTYNELVSLQTARDSHVSQSWRAMPKSAVTMSTQWTEQFPLHLFSSFCYVCLHWPTPIPMPIPLELCVITFRNEVVAKVMFLQVCVCPQGGGCLPQCMLGCHTPPGSGRPPWDQADPPGPGRSPRTRQTPPRTRQTPQDQADTNQTDTTSPRDQADPPTPRKQTPAYGLRAAGMHPTGMHSCCFIKKSIHLTLADSYSVLYSGADKYCTQFDTDIGTDEVNFFNVIFIATFASELVPV